MVVHGHRKHLLRVLLAYHEVIQHLLDLRGLDQPDRRLRVGDGLLDLAVYDRLADVDTRIADVDARSGDDLLDLRLRFSAEGAEGHSRRFCHGTSVVEPGWVSSAEITYPARLCNREAREDPGLMPSILSHPAPRRITRRS